MRIKQIPITVLLFIQILKTYQKDGTWPLVEKILNENAFFI